MININNNYSEIIKNNPLLTKKQEYELAKKAKSGDQEARIKLIQSNYRLVNKIASKYKRNNIDFKDLLQDSFIGLIIAVDRFDPDLGNKFSTYATWWIREAALKHINETLTDIKVPAHSRLLNAKIKKAANKLSDDLGRQPSIEEIASEVGESARKVNYTLKANGHATYLDKENPETGTTLKESFEDESTYSNPEKAYLSKELVKLVRESLSLLTPKEEKILRLRFGITEDENNTEEFPVTDEMMEYLND